MKRITITIDPQVFDNLPKRDRSAFINLVLKQHFQKENVDQLFLAIRQKLYGDSEFQSWVRSEAGQMLQEERNY